MFKRFAGENKILQNPDEAVVKVRVYRLHIFQRDGFSQQLFVERQCEASVDVVAVEHRHAHDTTHEVKVRQVLLKIKPGILESLYPIATYFFEVVMVARTFGFHHSFMLLRMLTDMNSRQLIYIQLEYSSLTINLNFFQISDKYRI